MSKVLVDRELLERAVSIPTKESLEANQAAIIDRGRAQSDIRELLAQPAEAEGVRDYLIEFAEGEVEAKTAIEELQDALSAVTAERDRLRAEVNSLLDAITAMAEARDRLRAETETLRKDAVRLEFVERYWFYEEESGRWAFMFSEDWNKQGLTFRDAIDSARAAMAAKEA